MKHSINNEKVLNLLQKRNLTIQGIITDFEISALFKICVSYWFSKTNNLRNKKKI